MNYGSGNAMPAGYSFLRRLLKDELAAKRLGPILLAAVGPGSDDELCGRMYFELLRRATAKIRLEGAGLGDLATPDEFVDDFVKRLHQIVRRPGVRLSTPDDFFKVSWLEFGWMLRGRRGQSRRRSDLLEREAPTLTGRGARDPLDHAVLEDELQRLERGLGELDKVDRQIFILHVKGGATLESIGESLSMSKSTVHRRLKLAIKRLRTALAGE